jgi:hypothetical protein
VKTLLSILAGSVGSPSTPAFFKSRYGVVYFAQDRTQPTLSKTTFPDGTPIVPGVISDPRKNPF